MQGLHEFIYIMRGFWGDLEGADTLPPPHAQATFKSTALIGSMDESNILLFYSHPIRANLKKIHLLIVWETGIRISINVFEAPFVQFVYETKFFYFIAIVTYLC